eukprot:gene9813-10820_t
MEPIESEEQLLNAHKEINIWLESMFSPRLVPQYEINKYTTNILYKIMKRNKELDRLLKISIDDITRKIEEYLIEDQQNQSILTEIGLSQSSLSQSGMSSLKTLSELAVLLNLKNCNLSSYLLALSDLSGRIERSSSDLKSQEIERQQLMNKFTAISNEKEAFERYFENLEQHALVQRPLAEKRRKETQFMKEKTKEYDALIQSLQESISQTELTDEIRHESLQQLSEELGEIRAQVKTLKTRLAGFHSLPPDMLLARVKVEEAKQELALLEKELYSDIQILNL